MKYLLDTQILIWALEDNPKLKTSIHSLIENVQNTILVSPISLMEISIKLKLNKLPEFITSIEDIIAEFIANGFDILPLTNHHIYTYQLVPLFEDHRDPFDRFLLAISLSEQIPIISADEKFTRYRPLLM